MAKAAKHVDRAALAAPQLRARSRQADDRIPALMVAVKVLDAAGVWVILRPNHCGLIFTG
jgi:hypothetical protein